MVKFICICLMIIFIASGCWDSREINELSFVMAMGLEKMENGNTKVTVQVAKASELTPGNPINQKPYWVISGEGRNTFEAIRNLSLRTPRRLYFAHNQIIIFDQSLAEEGMTKHLDLLLRNFELRQNVWLFVTQGVTPEQVLTVETEIESIPAMGLAGIIKLRGANEKTGVRSLLEFMRDSTGGTRASSCGIIKPVRTHDFPQGDIVSPPPQGSPQNMTTLFIEGTGVIFDKQLKTILDGPATMGYRLVTGQTEVGLIVFQCPFSDREDQHIAVEIVRNTLEVMGNIKNGEPSITVNLSLEVFLGEQQCQVDVTESGGLQQIERAAEQEARKLMSQAVSQTQRVKADILGFGQAMAMADRQWWRENKDIWPDLYPTAKVDYTVTVRILATEIRVKQRGD